MPMYKCLKNFTKMFLKILQVANYNFPFCKSIMNRHIYQNILLQTAY